MCDTGKAQKGMKIDSALYEQDPAGYLRSLHPHLTPNEIELGVKSIELVKKVAEYERLKKDRSTSSEELERLFEEIERERKTLE